MAEREDNLRTKDDRGRAVSMVDPYMLHLLRKHNTIDAKPLGQIAASLGSGVTTVEWILLVAAIVVALPLFIALVSYIAAVLGVGRVVWPTFGWVMITCLLPIPLGCWLRARQVRSRRVRSVMLAHRRCPHCGYDLRLLPVDPTDSATVCPECGCAWRLGAQTSNE